METRNLSLELNDGIVKGEVRFTDKQNPPYVDFEVVLKGHPLAKSRVIKYLNKEQSYEIPISSEVTDQYKTVVRNPTMRIDYFLLALCELGVHTEVFLSR